MRKFAGELATVRTIAVFCSAFGNCSLAAFRTEFLAVVALLGMFGCGGDRGNSVVGPTCTSVTAQVRYLRTNVRMDSTSVPILQKRDFGAGQAQNTNLAGVDYLTWTIPVQAPPNSTQGNSHVVSVFEPASTTGSFITASDILINGVLVTKHKDPNGDGIAELGYWRIACDGTVGDVPFAVETQRRLS